MPEPAWAQWSARGAERPWTIGVEEEVLLLDRDRWGVANRAGEVVAQLPPELAGSVGLETHACVLELRTGPHASVATAGAELARLRRRVAALLGWRLGLAAAAAGTHPLATRAEVEVSAGSRYRGIAETTRVLARREPTMALHVHVAVPTGDAAIRPVAGARHRRAGRARPLPRASTRRGLPRSMAGEVLDENRFRAARDGMRATLITPDGGRLQPARELLRRRLDELAPVANKLRCMPPS
jgi:gamma-glutamyl:cysteine ligase YbdK (ATP-grasp superfamily)